MILLGVILVLLGLVTGAGILYSLGAILLVVGVILYILGATNRAVGPRERRRMDRSCATRDQRATGPSAPTPSIRVDAFLWFLASAATRLGVPDPMQLGALGRSATALGRESG
jgi:hypothetical protein